MTILRYYHTIKHLKPVQIYGRLTFWLKRHLLSTGSSDELSRQAEALKKKLSVNTCEQVSFNLLNQKINFELDRVAWKSSDYSEKVEKLWVYNLNYFSWLFEDDKDFSENNLFLILDWIARNGNSKEEPWEPFPLAKRIVNWAGWCQKHPALPEEFADCIWQSVSNQCKRLYLDLEHHNQANHLLENLCALFIGTAMAGNWFEQFEDDSRQRLADTCNQLKIEIRDQFFADGGHYERSPMYHREMMTSINLVKDTARELILEDMFAGEMELPLFELITLCDDSLPLMEDWLALMTHPDGNVAQFNDCTLVPGILRQTSSSAPLDYLLEESGFFIRRTNQSYFVMSAGEPSPAFQPGHSHCDISSFELSVNKSRCIIDTGCGSYQNQQIRQQCRSSDAHNIALVEHTNQSDMWGSFRAGKRATVSRLHFDNTSQLLELEYIDHFDQRFRREIVFGSKSIKIRDRMFDRRITGTFCSMIHLAPQVMILPEIDAGCSSFAINDVRFFIRSSARLRSDSYIWYPEFGKPEKAVKLILSNHETEAIDYVISW